MDDQERTRDIYEQIPGYPKPPMIPLPALDDYDSLQTAGLVLNDQSRRDVNLAMRLSGFRAFQKSLPGRLENLLRQTNTRGPGLYAPAIAATLALEDDPRNLDPFQRAATLLVGARGLYNDLMSARLPPDTLKDQVLEMGQYPNLFGTHFIIENSQPRIYKTKNTCDIAVLVKGAFFILPIWIEGKEVSVEEIASALSEVAKQADLTGEVAPSPSLLSAASDPTQIQAFTALEKNPINRRSLDRLKNVYLTLCLDLDQTPMDLIEASLIGQSGNPTNRWHHTGTQIVVFGNAKAVMIGNFSAYLDGNIQMRGAAEIQRRGAMTPVESEPAARQVDQRMMGSRAEMLQWQIDPAWIEKAKTDLAAVKDEQQATYVLDRLGRERFLGMKVDPVSAFILALAITGNRLFGKTPHIVQFLTMSRYRCMDLVNTSMTTPQVRDFVDAMKQDPLPAAKARELFNESIQSQIEIARQTRRYLPLPYMFYLFQWSVSGWRRRYRRIVLGISISRLRKLGMMQLVPREIVISHPDIFPNVPIVGRPGVRLPYSKFFGLHYQIFADKTVITLMPGQNCKVTNLEIIQSLENDLERIASLMEMADGTESV